MRVLQGILLSLMVHFLLVQLVVWTAEFMPPPPSQAITVDIITHEKSQNETKSGQIVREALVPEKLKAEDSDDPLHFLSSQTQRVRKQSQALLNGMTKNRASHSPPKDHQKTTQSEEKGKKSEQPELDPRIRGAMDAYSPKYRKAPSLPQDLQQDPGLSTLGEALPKEVEVGSFTALNTDRYLYYSFFSRIEELIRFRWESSVQNAIDTTPPDRMSSNINGLWNTQLEIWLKPNGEFHSAHLMKESGLKAFDQAAVQAFIQARVFPNPPKEMVESDGLIHLKYGFQVRYSPKVLVKSRE